MLAVIMAGGRGRRLGGAVKPLIRVCGRAMMESVAAAAMEAGLGVVVAYSPASPGVAEAAAALGLRGLPTPGLGYSADLRFVWERMGEFLALPADTPFIRASVIEWFLRHATVRGEGVVTLIREGGCGGRAGGPVGVSFIRSLGGSYSVVEACFWPDLLDVDTPDDLREAEELCRGRTAA